MDFNKKSPALQWYPDKALADTRRLSWKANGIYRALLDTIWLQFQETCSIPDDDGYIAAELGCSLEDWQEARREIMCEHRPLLEIRDDRLFNRGLWKEMVKQSQRREKMSEAGRKGNRERWADKSPGENPDIARRSPGDEKAIAFDRSPSPSPSPIPSPTPTPNIQNTNLGGSKRERGVGKTRLPAARPSLSPEDPFFSFPEI